MRHSREERRLDHAPATPAASRPRSPDQHARGSNRARGRTGDARRLSSSGRQSTSVSFRAANRRRGRRLEYPTPVAGLGPRQGQSRGRRRRPLSDATLQRGGAGRLQVEAGAERVSFTSRSAFTTSTSGIQRVASPTGRLGCLQQFGTPRGWIVRDRLPLGLGVPVELVCTADERFHRHGRGPAARQQSCRAC